MAAMVFTKKGTINMLRATFLHRDYHNGTRPVVEGFGIMTRSRDFTSSGKSGREKSQEEVMGTTTDGKAPNVTMSGAADTAKDGMKQALDAAIEESGDASKPKKSVENEEGSEENVAVGDNGTVKGQNQSSG